jgi:hypothetical protein
MKDHWDALIESWVADPEMPLAVRKMGTGVRGGVTKHQSSGREIVLADNSPAQWAFSCAFRSHKWSVEELKSELRNDRVPFTFATKRSEKASVKYRATLSSCGIDLNKRGWKLCHVDPVGLKARTRIEDLPIDELKRHFRLLLRPSNHFLVPKCWSGLGELPEVIGEVRKYEEATNC